LNVSGREQTQRAVRCVFLIVDATGRCYDARDKGALMRLLIPLLVVCCILSTLLAADRDESNVSDDAITLMRKVQMAYGNVKTLEVTGKITSTITHGRFKRKSSKTFVGRFSAPNKYRLEIDGDAVTGGSDTCGCTGKILFSEKSDPLQRAVADVPTDAIGEMHWAFITAQLRDCPPIYFAAHKNGALEVVQAPAMDVVDVKIGADEQIDDKPYHSVIRGSKMEGRSVTLLIDPDTDMVRRQVDETMMPGGGITRVIDIETTNVDAELKDELFRWSPPKEWLDQAAAPASQPAPRNKTPNVF
jgi:hypothetical protein